LTAAHTCWAVVVGDSADPHVQEVVSGLPPVGLVVLDAATLSVTVRGLGLSSTVLLDTTGTPVVLSPAAPARGWVRRLAPAGWDHGVSLGSHRAALLSSRLALLGAILRDPAVTWLTPIDPLIAAENKIVQYRTARRLGLRVPETVVPTELAALTELSDPFLIKPLGVGNFEDGAGRQRVVYARTLSTGELTGVDLADAPFLAQRVLAARSHLRVVTVGGNAYAAELDAEGLPTDWRRHAPAHHEFQPAKLSPGMKEDALALAAALGVGYSSQDWLVDEHGPVFLDLNPGGQWLFLPSHTAASVTTALARWLSAEVAR
jgi:hypothetical protein